MKWSVEKSGSELYYGIFFLQLTYITTVAKPLVDLMMILRPIRSNCPQLWRFLAAVESMSVPVADLARVMVIQDQVAPHAQSPF